MNTNTTVRAAPVTTSQQPKRVGYRAMHYRVAAERGPAWTETCADCGEGADEWSYDHLDPDELEAEDAANLGAPYSLEVEHYVPRCGSCHARFDKRMARERQGIVDDAAVMTMFEDGAEAGPVMPIEFGWLVRKFYRECRGMPDDPLSDLRELLCMYISTQDKADLDALALWIAHTHLAARGVGTVTPRLSITAPSYGAGKSTALDFVRRLSHRGELITSTVSDALLPRLLQTEGFVTVCIDEADRVLKAENAGTMSVLNAGWQRGATTWVNQPANDGGWKPAKIETFSAVAFAGNGTRLAADVRQRMITVRLIKSDDMPEARWDGALQGVDDRLRARLGAMAERASHDVRVRNVRIPGGLEGRDRDRWSLLLATARAVGGPWVTKAEAMALADRDARAAEAAALGVAPNHQLAFDLFAVWREGETTVSTTELVERLIVHSPELWGVPSGKVLTVMSLGYRLREFYGVTPQQRNRVRGYSLPDIRKVWRAVSIPYDTEAPTE